LTDLPGELVELILCCDVLGAADIGRVSCTCRRLREACQPRGKVWRERFRLRWAAPLGPARPGSDGREREGTGTADGRAGLGGYGRSCCAVHDSCLVWQVPCDGFSDIETLGCPSHFFEDELMCILNMEGR
ncbi:FBX21 protein, partial [Spizella passerina]|nr:FBX21 protein [Spizella passerina]